ncbi:MAG: STAS domain-containing protein [Bacteroidota bacterium]|nr:STAS domain-containing protein [Bacteroidota bacterium]
MAASGQISVNMERSGTCAIARINGRIDSSNTFDFERSIQSGLVSDDESLILECTSLVYTSSAGLRVMLKLARQFQPPKLFVICGLRDDILEIFRISGFDRIMTIRPTLEDALAL